MSKRFARYWQRTLLSYGMCKSRGKDLKPKILIWKTAIVREKVRKSDSDARRIDKKDRESSETSGISSLICAIKS